MGQLNEAIAPKLGSHRLDGSLKVVNGISH
jgi:hypothetical protein